MMFKNTLFTTTLSALLLLSCATLVSADGVEVAIVTDSASAAPKNANYACVVKSTSCKSDSRFTDDITYDPHLKLTTCHHDGFVRNWWHRLSPFSSAKGMFTNTFYVEDCDQHKGPKKSTRQIRDILDDGINSQTNCNAYIQCFNVKDVDDKCFPKED
ncbi:Transcription factor [Pseudozyma hubeiensis]|nr:Transcription factor [Pseudozyma hubeiensis]